ncbi:MAG TPA: hypothetical protein VND64_23845 [Pirellulales bacterium]|nr:hypothetical protein [Pirellulales bacterium]
MKTWNRLILPLGVALVVVVVGALLYHARATVWAALADGEDQDSIASASLAAQENALPAAPADEENNSRNADQEDDEQPEDGDDGEPEDEKDDWRSNMRNAPNEARQAIAELERAGVRVFLCQYQRDEEVDEDTPGEPDQVTFRASGAAANQAGFESPFTRKALGQLLRSLPNVERIDLRDTNVSDDHLQEMSAVVTVTDLTLDNTPITDKGLAQLAGLTDMVTLSLGDTHVCDEGLAHLRGMKRL